MERKSKIIFGFDLNDPPLIVEKKTREKNEKNKPFLPYRLHIIKEE